MPGIATKAWQESEQIQVRKRLNMVPMRGKSYQEYLKEAIRRKDKASQTYQFILNHYAKGFFDTYYQANP